MKNSKITLMLVIALFGLSNISTAKVWRINNNPGADADFTSPQTAVNDASVMPGDTLHLESSATSYGALNLTKKLVLLGPGYFLGSGATENDSLQAITTSAKFSSLSFSAGSDSSIAKGLVITSLTVANGANNIYFSRNYVTSATFLYGSFSNFVASQNYFGADIREQQAGSKTNFVFKNNILTYIRLSPDDNGIFENNVQTSATSSIFTAFILRNNIFNGTLTCTACTMHNNIGDATQFPNNNGNQQNVAWNTIFELTGSTDEQYKLKAGSPAIGAGVGGIDCGAFGGMTPYVLSGIPNIPTIYYLNTGTVINNNMLDVNLSTRSNN